MEKSNSLKAVRVRTICPECKKYFAAMITSGGDIVGQCPNCHTQYYEHRRNNIRMIKTIKRK